MLLLLLANVSVPASPPCSLSFEIVGNEAAARAIAEVVIASAPAVAPRREILRYDIKIDYVEARRSWLASQIAVSANKSVRILGGDGLAMEIAACDGAVSSVHRMR